MEQIEAQVASFAINRLISFIPLPIPGLGFLIGFLISRLLEPSDKQRELRSTMVNYAIKPLMEAVQTKDFNTAAMRAIDGYPPYPQYGVASLNAEQFGYAYMNYPVAALAWYAAVVGKGFQSNDWQQALRFAQMLDEIRGDGEQQKLESQDEEEKPRGRRGQGDS